MITIAGPKSNNCQEDCSSPAIDNYIHLSDNITYCQEGADMVLKSCFKCGYIEGTLQKKIGENRFQIVKIISHHISYNPEVLVDCCLACHRKIHYKIRKDNMCKLSIDEVHRLSRKSGSYRYQKENVKNIDFYETFMPCVRLHEKIMYDTKSGNIYYYSGFVSTNGNKLKYIEVE